MQVILVHGWGFHAGLWDAVIPRLGRHEGLALDLAFVRGGPKGWGEIPPDCLCVGHSFGLLWLLKHGPRPMRGLISVAGFDCFKAHVPLESIAAMQAGLDRNPAAQMRGFWRACGLLEDFAESECLDVATLKAGLDWLATWDARDQRRELRAPTLALASEDDRIVPKAASQAMWGDGANKLLWRGQGGHALPLTAPEWCAQQIVEFADAL